MSFLGKIKKSLILLILTAVVGSFFITTVHAGFADTLGKLFSTQDQGLSFTQFEGKINELDAAGYDPSLTSSTSLKEYILKVVNFALGFLGLLAVIIVIYGGVLYVTAAGEEEKTQKGKKAITYAAVGLLIVLGSFAFVNTIIKGAGGDGTENGQYIVGANAGASFNASATEVRNIAKEIYDGFIFLAEVNEEVKNIQNDASKSSLDFNFNSDPSGKINGPNIRAVLRADVVSFLYSEKQKLLTIRNRFEKFSSAYIAINETLRLLDKDLGDIQGYSERLWHYEYNDDKDGLEYENNNLVDCNDTGEDDDWIPEDWINACERYPRDMVETWNSIRNEVLGITVDGSRSLEKVLKPIREDYEKTVKNKLAELVAIKQTLSGIEAAKTGGVGKLYDTMMDHYGYDPENPSASGSTDSFIAKLKKWKLSIVPTDVEAIGAVLYSALETQLKLADAIAKLQSVEAHLRANVVSGNAPLVVTFDALDSKDPAGGSLSGANITWNLDGSKTFDNKDVEIDASNAVECTVPTSTDDKELYGPAFRQCTFKYPGTYVSTITVKSNDSTKYVSGTSSLLIKVNPPTTKIELTMKIGDKTSVPIIGYYDNGILKTDKDYVPVTLSEVKTKKSIIFDATDTTNIASYKWDFGNGEAMDGVGDAYGEQSTQYTEKGKYKVELTVVNKLGEVDTKIFTIDVRDVAARISVKPNDKAFIGNNINIDASESSASGGKIKAYEWQINRLTAAGEEKVDLGADASKVSFNYKFKEPGKYRINLKITSDLESVEAQPYILKVESKPPVAMFENKSTDKTQPGTIYFKGSDSYDPDGDKENLSYQWSIKPENDNNETWKLVKDTALQDVNPVIKFKKKGEYDVTLRVSDSSTIGPGLKEEYSIITKTIVVDNVLDVAWNDTQQDTAQLDSNGKATLNFALISESGKDFEIKFGDGEESAGKLGDAITHSYTEAGKYEVTAKVYDADDNSNTITRRVYVNGGNKPIAKISVFINNEEIYDLSKPIIVSKKDNISFDAVNSKNTDGSGRNLNYSWDFGDTQNSSKKNTFHTFGEISPKDPGYYKVKLRIVDQEDPTKFDEDEVQVKVVNMPPRFASIQGIPQFQLTGVFTTPVNVAMKVYEANDIDGTVTKYKWWYFDVNKPENPLGIQVTQQPTAALQIGTNGQEGAQVTYGFGLEITDNDNLSYSNQDEIDSKNFTTITVKNGPNKAPIAKFNVNSTSVFAGDSVNFTSSSTDPDGQIKTYVWDVEGDGFFNNEPTTKSSIDHVYTEKNKQGYKARLKVVDDKGGEDVSDLITIYVDSLAKPPKAAFKTEVISGSDGLKIKFINNSEADEDAGAKIIDYKWDFDTASVLDSADSDGDGIKDNDVDSSAANPERLYTDIGNYKVKLTITDDQGNTEETIGLVKVPLANPPTAAFTYENKDGQIIFKNNSIADISNSAVIVKNLWDFDAVLDGDGDGKGDNDQESIIKEPTHSYPKAGKYKVKLTVTDSQGSTNSITNEVDFNAVVSTGTDTIGGELKAILNTVPVPSSDGVIYLSGTSGSVKFDFSSSIGAISSYRIDKNIYFDTDLNGIKNDDVDYQTPMAGNWKTNFDKSWGKTVVKLTVVDLYGNENTASYEIKFK